MFRSVCCRLFLMRGFTYSIEIDLTAIRSTKHVARQVKTRVFSTTLSPCRRLGQFHHFDRLSVFLDVVTSFSSSTNHGTRC